MEKLVAGIVEGPKTLINNVSQCFENIESNRRYAERAIINIWFVYGLLKKYNDDGMQGIRNCMTKEIRLEHRAFLELNRTYHNAYISRPYVLFADNQTDAPLKRFCQLKQIRDGRDVIFVEGSLTRLGSETICLIMRQVYAGFQAMDIGHIDLEYEWYLNGSGERSEVRTKYNNALLGGGQVEDVDDREYYAQIIEQIC